MRDEHDRAQALPTIRRLGRKIERLKAERVAEIRAAVEEDGRSLRAVAEAAGMTPEGVRQLLKREAR